jgi:hypothetical protein
MNDASLDLDEVTAPKRRSGLLLFLLGLLLGIAGALLAPRYLGDYLPDGLRGRRETIEGPVLGKRLEENRLLLTVQGQQGAVLATFRKQVAEIDLLVGVGDTVTLGVSRYEPFVEDPSFRGVRKIGVGSLPESPASGANGASETGGGTATPDSS